MWACSPPGSHEPPRTSRHADARLSFVLAWVLTPRSAVSLAATLRATLERAVVIALHPVRATWVVGL